MASNFNISSSKSDRIEILLKIYEVIVDEEHYYSIANEKNIAFYSGIITALFAGTVVSLLRTTEWYHLIALCLAPTIIYIISDIAVESTQRFYHRWLVTVTMRAKIEQELGLTVWNSNVDDASNIYWQTEPIIALRHIESRKNHPSSEDFIEANLEEGNRKWTVKLFIIFKVSSAIMLVLLLFLAIMDFYSLSI